MFALERETVNIALGSPGACHESLALLQSSATPQQPAGRCGQRSDQTDNGVVILIKQFLSRANTYTFTYAACRWTTCTAQAQDCAPFIADAAPLTDKELQEVLQNLISRRIKLLTRAGARELDQGRRLLWRIRRRERPGDLWHLHFDTGHRRGELLTDG